MEIVPPEPPSRALFATTLPLCLNICFTSLELIEFLAHGGLPTILLQTGGGVRTRITLCACSVCTQRKFGIKGVLWPRQDPNLQIGVLISDINLCALGLSTAWWTRTGRCLLGCSAPTTWNSWVPLHVQSGAQKWSSKSSRNSRLGRAQPPPMAPGHPFCKGFPTVNCCLLPRPSLRPFSFPLGCLFRP